MGLIGGHVLHQESTLAWRMLARRNQYHERLQYQYNRDHPPSTLPSSVPPPRQ